LGEAQLHMVIERAPEAVNPDASAEVVADKGYHSNATLLAIESRATKSYISEPDRGRRKRKDDVDAKMAFTRVAGGFVESAVSGCIALGASVSSGPSHTTVKDAGASAV
jgi:hypothetical protein